MKARKTKNICLSMDIEVLKKVDSVRGLVKRSTYINDAARKAAVEDLLARN